MTPEKDYRVRLGLGINPDGQVVHRGIPMPLREIRKQRKAGFQPDPPITKSEELRLAESLMATKQPSELKERRNQPEFVARLEAVMKEIVNAENREQATGDPKTQQLLSSVNPIKIMADQTLDYMGKPLSITSSEQWESIKKLTEATKIFYTDPKYQLMIEAGAKARAIVLSEVVQYWIKEKCLLSSPETRIEPKTIFTLFKALARIRSTDSLYYQGMFFPGTTDPSSFVSNLASLYENTARELIGSLDPENKKRVTDPDQIASVNQVVHVFRGEADSLRIIQAQNYEFIVYDRPIEIEVVLLNLVDSLNDQIGNDPNSSAPDFDKYAQQVLDVLRARRCSLTNEEIQKTCSFLLKRFPRGIRRALGDGSMVRSGPKKRGVSERIPYHHLLPWILLKQSADQDQAISRLKARRATEDQIEKAQTELTYQRYHQLMRLGPSHSDRRPVVCRTLSRTTFPPAEVMEEVVPRLILKMRQSGYLKNIGEEFYRGLGLRHARSLFEDHQRELREEKEPLFIKQGDIVVFVPLSGWCITNAHRELAIAARDLAPKLIKLTEIQNHQPIRDRDVRVIFTFGESPGKITQGMPPAKQRIELGQEAIKMDRDIYVAPFGYIDEKQERSERIKQMMKKIEQDFNISWSTHDPQSTDYPGEGCLPVIVGGTDKLGPFMGGTRPIIFSCPEEDNEFLNKTAQIVALLQEDIDSPFKMGAFITSFLNRFNLDGPGGTLLLTSVSDVHSSLASSLIQALGQAIKNKDKLRQRKCFLAFLTMVPPRIASEAWAMISARAGQDSLRDSDLIKKFVGDD